MVAPQSYSCLNILIDIEYSWTVARVADFHPHTYNEIN